VCGDGYGFGIIPGLGCALGFAGLAVVDSDGRGVGHAWAFAFGLVYWGEVVILRAEY